jgi:hypothetical protein
LDFSYFPLLEGKKYYVTIPEGISHGQSFQASLGGVEYTVRCPPNSRGGDMIIVTAPEVAPSVASTPATAYVTAEPEYEARMNTTYSTSVADAPVLEASVIVMDKSRSQAPSDTMRASDQVVECSKCTYHNLFGASKCEMCESSLSYSANYIKSPSQENFSVPPYIPEDVNISSAAASDADAQWMVHPEEREWLLGLFRENGGSSTVSSSHSHEIFTKLLLNRLPFHPRKHSLSLIQ